MGGTTLYEDGDTLVEVFCNITKTVTASLWNLQPDSDLVIVNNATKQEVVFCAEFIRNGSNNVNDCLVVFVPVEEKTNPVATDCAKAVSEIYGKKQGLYSKLYTGYVHMHT